MIDGPLSFAIRSVVSFNTQAGKLVRDMTHNDVSNTRFNKKKCG